MSRLLAFRVGGVLPSCPASIKSRTHSVCSVVQPNAQYRGFSQSPAQKVKLLACDMVSCLLQ